MQDNSLGFFGRWFPTEHQRYLAMIVMLYVGIAVSVIGGLCELALSGLSMLGIFGLPPSLHRLMNSLEVVSGIGTLISLAFVILIIYLLYKTRSLVYLLKMFLGYFVVALLFGLVAALISTKLAFVLLLIGVIATIYVNRNRWHYISKYRRYIYYVLGTWLVCALGNVLVVSHIVSSLSRLFFGFGRLSTGTIFGYVLLVLLLWLLPVFCQHYIYYREEKMGTTFYQAFRLINTVPPTALFFIFGISSLANIGTLSGEGMFTAFDFDYTGNPSSAPAAAVTNKPSIFAATSQTGVPQATSPCPHCGAPVAADAAFCSQCGTALRHCPACGQLVDDKAKFCPACGAYLLNSATLKEERKEAEKAAAKSAEKAVPPVRAAKPAASMPVKPQPVLKAPAPGPDFLADKKKLTAIALVLVVLLAGGTYWYMNREDTKPQETTPVLTPKDDADQPEKDAQDTDAKQTKKAADKAAVQAEDPAQQAFLDYHQAISQHHIQAAYNLLDADFQNAVGGYDGYAPGYNNTLSSEVSQLHKLSGSDTQEVVSFTLKARDRVPGSQKVKVQHFNGQATLVKVGNAWKIGEIKAQKTGEETE